MTRKLLKGVVGISIFMGLAILVSSWGLKDSHATDSVIINIENSTTGGESLINEEYVKKLVEVNTGRDLDLAFQLTTDDLIAIESVIINDPFVNRARVFSDQSNHLHISLQTKEPIARVIDDQGKNYYITSLGDIVPFSYSYSPRVVVVTGFLPEVGGDDWAKVIELVQKANNNKFMRSQMESIFITRNKEVIIIPKLGDFKINFGEISNVDKKFEKLESFYKSSFDKIDWSKYSELILDYQNQVILKKSKNRA